MIKEVNDRFICCLYLFVLIVTSPLCALVSTFVWFFGWQRYPDSAIPQYLRKRILVTGDSATKALHVIRMLGKAGHTIIVTDWLGPWSVLRWSRYVSKVYTVPKQKNNDASSYIAALIQIGLKEQVDYFIPVVKKDYAVADAQVGEVLTEHGIKCLLTDRKQIEILDDKLEFLTQCREYNLSVPPFYRLSSTEDAYKLAADDVFEEKHFFMKPSACSSAFRNSFQRIPNTKLELQHFLKHFQNEEFFATEFIKGKEIAANLLCKNGELLALNISTSSPIQVDYDVIANKKVTDWVETFCRKSKSSGALCFDFLEDKNGDIYCLECNPRFHSSLVTYLYDPNYEKCLRGTVEETPDQLEKKFLPFQPKEDVFAYWLYQEIFRVVSGKRSVDDFRHIIKTGHEAFWDSSDAIPFFIYHHIQVSVSLLQHIVWGGYWEKVNFCLGRVMY